MLDAIRNLEGERLDHTFGLPAGDDAPGRDLVVLGHGVTANKDRPFLVALADALNARGIATLRFSFAGNGDSEGRFEAATVTKEVADLGAVLDVVAGHRVIYVGHSQGAAVGVLRASRDLRVRALVSLAGMVHTADFAERKFGALTPGSDVMWDKTDCPLSQAYVDDMAAIGSVLDAARLVEVPWLLVHGHDDQVVPFRDAEDAREARGGAPELIALDAADHVFSGDAVTAAMVDAVAPWCAARFAELDA